MRSSNLLRLAALLVVGLPSLAQERAARKAGDPADKPADKGIKLAGVHSRFEHYDADRGGTLDANEAAQAGLGPRDFSSYDANQDQKLGKDEFVVAFHSVMSARGAKIADDLSAEVARIQAATAKLKPATPPAAPTPVAPTPAAPVEPATPEPARPRNEGARNEPRVPVVPPVPAEEAKASLESKVDSALRAAQGDKAPAAHGGETPRREREGAADGAPAKPNIEAKAADAEAALNKRLRNSDVDPELAAQERTKLRKRVANALGETGAPQPGAPEVPVENAGSPQTAPGAPPAPPADPQAGIEAKAKAMEAALEQRMRNQGKSEEEIAAAKAHLKTRTDNALSKGQKPDESAPPSEPPPAAPAGPKPDPAKAASDALEQRLKNKGASPEEAEKARQRLRERVDNRDNKDNKPAKHDGPRKRAADAPARPKPQPPAEAKEPTPPKQAEKQQAKAAPSMLSGPVAMASAVKTPPRPYAMQPAARLPATMPSLPPPPRFGPARPGERKPAAQSMSASARAIQAARLEEQKQRAAAAAKAAPNAKVATARPTPAGAQPPRAPAAPNAAKSTPTPKPPADAPKRAAPARENAAKGDANTKPAKPKGDRKRPGQEAAGGKAKAHERARDR